VIGTERDGILVQDCHPQGKFKETNKKLTKLAPGSGQGISTRIHIC